MTISNSPKNIRDLASKIAIQRFHDTPHPLTHRSFFCIPKVEFNEKTHDLSLIIEYVACETVGLIAIQRNFQAYIHSFKFSQLLNELNEYKLNRSTLIISENDLKEQRDHQLQVIERGACDCEDIQISYTHNVVYHVENT